MRPGQAGDVTVPAGPAPALPPLRAHEQGQAGSECVAAGSRQQVEHLRGPSTAHAHAMLQAAPSMPDPGRPVARLAAHAAPAKRYTWAWAWPPACRQQRYSGHTSSPFAELASSWRQDRASRMERTTAAGAAWLLPLGCHAVAAGRRVGWLWRTCFLHAPAHIKRRRSSLQPQQQWTSTCPLPPALHSLLYQHPCCAAGRTLRLNSAHGHVVEHNGHLLHAHNHV